MGTRRSPPWSASSATSTVAEEAAQEAFAIAAERWPRTGMPGNPGAWLVATARNKAIDRIRRERIFAAKSHLLVVVPEPRGRR